MKANHWETFLTVLQSGIQRGSPHIIRLTWLKGAPAFGVGNDTLLTDYTEDIINYPERQKLVKRQIHRHFHTCRKKSKNECRFDYPQPPLRTTKILFPF